MLTRVIEFTATEESGRAYQFKGNQLETGEVVIPSSQTADEWYGSADEVDAHGTDTIDSYIHTGKIAEWSSDEIATSVRGSIREFGQDAVPQTLRAYALGNVGTTEDF